MNMCHLKSDMLFRPILGGKKCSLYHFIIEKSMFLVDSFQIIQLLLNWFEISWTLSVWFVIDSWFFGSNIR